MQKPRAAVATAIPKRALRKIAFLPLIRRSNEGPSLSRSEDVGTGLPRTSPANKLPGAAAGTVIPYIHNARTVMEPSGKWRTALLRAKRSRRAGDERRSVISRPPGPPRGPRASKGVIRPVSRVPGILRAHAADTADRRLTLLKGREVAVRASALRIVIRAPGIEPIALCARRRGVEGESCRHGGQSQS